MNKRAFESDLNYPRKKYKLSKLANSYNTSKDLVAKANLSQAANISFSMAAYDRLNSFKNYNLNGLKNAGGLLNQNSGIGTKKLTIKNLNKSSLTNNNSYQSDILNKLVKTVHAIYDNTSIAYSLEELFQGVEILCENSSSQLLYQELKKLFENYIKAHATEFNSLASDSAIVFLNLVNKFWNTFCQQNIMISNIFLYLDRSPYVLQNPSIFSIWDLGLDMFRRYIMSITNIQTKLIDGILFMIDKERHGESIDRSLIKNLLRMLLDLQLYNSLFQPKFLAATDTLCKVEGERYINELKIPEYLNYVKKCLGEEYARLSHYLNFSTKSQLIQTVEKRLVEDHLQVILSKGLDDMLNQNKTNELALLFRLLNPIVNGHKELCLHFTAYVKIKGREMVMDLERDKTMVQELLDFKYRLDEIIENCFESNEKFAVAVKEAFENFINQRPNKPAELLAKYIDTKLRSGNKESSEDELEKTLDKVMVLFRFIHGKDVFEAFYKKDLAKRLLVGKSASIDAEKCMLTKLKQECGAGYTNKLEGMFKDMDLSRDIMISYKQYLINHPLSDDIDLSVSILTMGYWPTYAPVEIILPPKMMEYQENFQKFYLSKHTGRKLKWQSTLGHCVVKAYFDDGTMKKELQVSLFQALCLLLFNDKEELSFEDIKLHTAIDPEELKKTLQSLACGKARVLKKIPAGKDVEMTDIFTFNNKFNHKLFRVKINQIQMKETKEENTATQEKVFQDRQYQIDAAIVRIMKTRKTLTHALLLSELYAQLKFPVKPSDLKKRIESLIERDYMHRDKDSSNTYQYVA